MANTVSITRQQRDFWGKLGKRLLSGHFTSGYQLEDYNPKRKSLLVYGHDNPRHLAVMHRNLGGSLYPRDSWYLWKKSWKKGTNTVLHEKKKYAEAHEAYIATLPTKKRHKYIVRRGIDGRGGIKKSWEVPDVRRYGGKKPAHFRKAYLVTVPIDSNSRFSTIIIQKRKLSPIRKVLKGERVRRVYVQDYQPEKHSLYVFIKKKEGKR